MFKIQDEHGAVLADEFASYDLSCRVAHYLRRSLGLDCFVVRNGRAVSEVFYTDTELDGWARYEADRILIESRVT